MGIRSLAGMIVACYISASLLAVPAHAASLQGSTSSSLGWSSPTTMPAARAGAAVALGRDGNIYVFGGTDGRKDYNTVFIYHPSRNAWSMGTTMPFAVEGAAAVALPDGRIMVMGGGTGCHYTQQCTTYNSVEVYNPKAHSWCLLASMHMSHYRFPAVLGPDGRVYAIGGWNGTSALAAVEAYSIRKNVWTFAIGLPQAEESAAAVVTRHRIAVMGGFDGANTYYNNLFVFNGRTWASGSPMPTTRANLGAAVGPGGLIYAVGGYAPQSYLATVEAYDPKSDSWSSKASLPIPVMTPGTVSTGDGHIYVFGGWNGNPSAQVVEFGKRSACGCLFGSS